MTVDSRNNLEDRPSPEGSPVPASCPECGSTAIATAAKQADVNAYWRCGGCGEVWNVARRTAGVEAWRRR